MYVLITGSRDFAASGFITTTLDEAHAKEQITHLVLGDYPTGADAIAKVWAETNNVSHTVLKADWDKHGRSAGPPRNTQMVDELCSLSRAVPTEAVYCIGFTSKPLYSSRGTANCLDQCLQYTDFPVYYFRPNGETVLNVLRSNNKEA